MANHDFKKGKEGLHSGWKLLKKSHFQVKLQFENNSSIWIGHTVFGVWIVQFDEFFIQDFGRKDSKRDFFDDCQTLDFRDTMTNV